MLLCAFKCMYTHLNFYKDVTRCPSSLCLTHFFDQTMKPEGLFRFLTSLLDIFKDIYLAFCLWLILFGSV